MRKEKISLREKRIGAKYNKGRVTFGKTVNALLERKLQALESMFEI